MRCNPPLTALSAALQQRGQSGVGLETLVAQKKSKVRLHMVWYKVHLHGLVCMLDVKSTGHRCAPYPWLIAHRSKYVTSVNMCEKV